MKLSAQVIEELLVVPGHAADLHKRSTKATTATSFKSEGGSTPRELVERDLESLRNELAASQELLYAADRYAILVIIQALDAGGKDGTIKHVMSGVNPQGCNVVSFKTPSAEELSHDFLWRCVKSLPEKGHIGIFNRSYYEDVLVTSVHPELVTQANNDFRVSAEDFWRDRYEDINAFERHLERSGTTVVKLFLHVSKDEQKQRLLDRLDEPTKNWKFSTADLSERPFFDQYTAAYEKSITATSTTWAPWYVIPADHKHQAWALVGGVLTNVIEQLDLSFPQPSAEEQARLDQARQDLINEPK